MYTRKTVAAVSTAALLLSLAMPALAEDGHMLKPASLKVDLTAIGSSGESGSATLTREDGGTRVIVNVTGEPADATQPTHFHMGSCANLGGVKWALNDIVNGTSNTKLDISLDTLLAGLPLAINTHKSASEMAVNMACGDVKKPEEREAKPVFDGACMAAATDKREPALIAAYAAKNTAIAAGLTARRTALHDAWLKPTFKERHDALRKGWKEWRAAIKKARQDFRKARHEAWKQFYADRKACAQKDRGGDHGIEDDDQD